MTISVVNVVVSCVFLGNGACRSVPRAAEGKGIGGVARNLLRNVHILSFAKFLTNPCYKVFLTSVKTSIVGMRGLLAGNRFYHCTQPLRRGAKQDVCFNGLGQGGHKFTIGLGSRSKGGIFTRLIGSTSILLRGVHPNIVGGLKFNCRRYGTLGPHVVFTSVSKFNRCNPCSSQPNCSLVTRTVNNSVDVAK